jgi:hypothetical protein
MIGKSPFLFLAVWSEGEIQEIADEANQAVNQARENEAMRWLRTLSLDEIRSQLGVDETKTESLLAAYLEVSPDESEDDYNEAEFIDYCFDDDEFYEPLLVKAVIRNFRAEIFKKK